MDKKEEILFESLLAKKRHDELINVVKQLLQEISKLDNSKEIKNLTDVSIEKYPEIVNAIKSIGKLKSPDVNVELNQKEVIQSINEIKDYIIKRFDKVSEPKKSNWEFTVQRDLNGYIKTVKAEQID